MSRRYAGITAILLHFFIFSKKFDKKINIIEGFEINQKIIKSAVTISERGIAVFLSGVIAQSMIDFKQFKFMFLIVKRYPIYIESIS
ncbi:MAG: hypothetical protein WBA77_15555 [Microcoleaceae cyanobacterium]